MNKTEDKAYNKNMLEEDKLEVTIRCRRHRKRRKVPAEWIKTCEWLCPNCYNKLTAQERERYAPKGKTEQPAHQETAKPTEVVKPIVCTHSTKAKPRKIEVEIEEREDPLRLSHLAMKDSVLALLPRYRIVCRRCKKTVPCHQSWLSKSMVLCPSCYSEMSEWQVDSFHSRHPNSEADVFKVAMPFSVSETKKAAATDGQFQSPDKWSAIGGRCSTDYIMHASIYDLRKAIREGRLSRTRAKIELRRRKHADYFYDMPDADIPLAPA